jgi:hypothetical protein
MDERDDGNPVDPRPPVEPQTQPEALIERWAGAFSDDVYPPGYLASLRAEWDS